MTPVAAKCSIAALSIFCCSFTSSIFCLLQLSWYLFLLLIFLYITGPLALRSLSLPLFSSQPIILPLAQLSPSLFVFLMRLLYGSLPIYCHHTFVSRRMECSIRSWSVCAWVVLLLCCFVYVTFEFMYPILWTIAHRTTFFSCIAIPNTATNVLSSSHK